MAAGERLFRVLIVTPLVSGALVVLGVLLTPAVLAEALLDMSLAAARRVTR